MKYFELDKQEKTLLNALDRGSLKRVKNFSKKRAEYASHARSALAKSKNINIRLSEQDLLKLKSRAISEGIPYQTYLASVVRRHLKV